MSAHVKHGRFFNNGVFAAWGEFRRQYLNIQFGARENSRISEAAAELIHCCVPYRSAYGRNFANEKIDPVLLVARGSYREVKCLNITDKVYKGNPNSRRVE